MYDSVCYVRKVQPRDLSIVGFIHVDDKPLDHRVRRGWQRMRDEGVLVLDSAQRGIDHPHKRPSSPDLSLDLGSWTRGQRMSLPGLAGPALTRSGGPSEEAPDLSSLPPSLRANWNSTTLVPTPPN